MYRTLLIVMKEQILKLRSEGKTYREIEKLIGCSRSLIAYYVNPDGKRMLRERQHRNRFRLRTKYKQMLGGKCCLCGYNKCMDALHFHHKDESKKLFEISDAIFSRRHGKHSDEDIQNEVQKCMLVCANCHHEIHSKNNFQ